MKFFTNLVLYTLLLLNPVIAHSSSISSWRYNEAVTCNTISTGQFADLCHQTSDNSLWKCMPTIGIGGTCNTSNQWVQVGGTNPTWGTISGTLSNQSDLVTALAGKEASLGNPSTNGYILSSTTAGTRSWIAPPSSLAWGNITGTLSSQTDLQNALNLKQNTITQGTTSQYFKGDFSLGTFPTALSSFTNDSGYLTSSTATSTYVPLTTTVNGHALSSNVTVTPTDLGLVIGTNVQAYNSNLTGINQALTSSSSPNFTALNINGGTSSGTSVDVNGTVNANYFNVTTFGQVLDNNANAHLHTLNINGLTDSELISTDGSDNLQSLSTATYPSLTELSYVKGVTSAIQTQLNTKGAGTVTSASVATANGFSGTVANASTTPAITIVAGAITPTSVNGVVLSGSSTPTLAVTGTTAVSGTNTGDQTNIPGNAATVTTNANMTGDVTSFGSNATTVAKIAGVAVGTPTGTTNVVFSNSPTLVTPILGAASATSLTTTGNVGIGTITPSATLGIVGNIGIGSTSGDSFVTTAPPLGGMIVSGNVGIGTTTVSSALQVNGNSTFISPNYVTFSNSSVFAMGVGGILTTYTSGSIYAVHTFTTSNCPSGCNFTAPSGNTAVHVLVVAGGGSGGGNEGGGGGAGGYIDQASYATASNQVISISVGAGGANSLSGNSGSNSSFGTLTAIGGGHGGAGGAPGVTGGSGGGHGSNQSSSATGVAGTAGQGYAGGGYGGGGDGVGGGGGGASAVGTLGTTSAGSGSGGSGYTSTISSASYTYSCGGSGGALNGVTPGSPGCASAGSGSHDGLSSGGNATGYGSGGGGGTNNNRNGGSGFDGIVIVSYVIPYLPTSVPQSVYSLGGIGLGVNHGTSWLNIVGIGTTSATSSINVKNSSSIQTFGILDNGQTYLSGNVGIGSTVPGQALDVNGTIRALSSGACSFLYKCVGGVDAGVIQTAACNLCPAGSCTQMNGCF